MPWANGDGVMGTGGANAPPRFLRGAAPPLKKELSLPRFLNFDLHPPPPPFVRSRRDLKHKDICHPGLGENHLQAAPPQFIEGGSARPQFYTLPPLTWNGSAAPA